ncbi:MULTISPECIES: PspA/IM30 family protein [Rhodanobacter]|uniref:PspA/IM30 family protein n=1 Tax=Rhodanobacter hydrolyticus TaxID=2250595 RepID=A0ABW8J9B1_9GAMM|nr:PspA/IM30 family protein [Rhodanobacter sp. 7MK24]MBD8879828.1 PspA/IM30 family protein [Rhodanobacter sp. 7MK24]
MAIIEKLITLVRGTATEAGQAIVDRNAITILEQEIRDSNTALDQSKVDLTKLMAERKIASDKLDAKKAKVADFNATIQKLVDKGDQQALALEVAGKVAALENEITSDSATIKGMDDNIERLRGSIRQAESTVEHLTRQIDTVKATASVQRAQEAIASRTSGSNAKLRTAMDSLDRIQEQQRLKDAQLDAAKQLEESSGDGDLQKRLQAAGVAPADTAAADVLARFTKPAG